MNNPSRSARRVLWFALLLTCLCPHAGAQTTQVQTAYSTHDFNSRPPLPNEATILPAVWADVKTPGNGRTYSVGSVIVATTRDSDGSQFSGRNGLRVPTYPQAPFQNGFTITPGGSRQVVVLQCCGVDPMVPSGPNDDQSILWQNYWYGNSFRPNDPIQGPWARRVNHARGISVWPAATELDTRIAICGGTYDMLMDSNQWNGQQGWDLIQSTGNTSNPLAQNGLPNGFIAVYNGAGFLLRSFQFYFEGVEGHSAITDVSIRVEETPEGPRDVVTYCGISSFGVRSTAQGDRDQTLAPVRPFLAPVASLVPGYMAAAGDTDNGTDQWDGIVGRLSNSHNSPDPTATVVDFHSVVGGVWQDGLWGIAEIDANRFVVVGGTANVSAPPVAAGGTPTFPFTLMNATNWNALDAYYVGAVLVFDAGPTRTGGRLWLEASQPVGSPGAALHTHARDVALQHDASTPVAGLVPRIVLVGATDDPNVFATIGGLGPGLVPTSPFGGMTDGFVVSLADSPTPPGPTPGVGFFNSLAAGTFFGGEGAEGFTGIAGWNEHPDHVTALGFAPGGDLTVATFLSDTPSTSPWPANEALLLVRSDVVLSPAAEVPAATGPAHATETNALPWANPSLLYDEQNLGSPAGGGIAIDQRGRVDVVGSTSDMGYPMVGPLARPFTRFGTSGTNGIRSVINMLPPGVGRTDGTGLSVPIVGTADGGTTPACLRAPFGLQIGMTPPLLKRMLIDYEGPPPSVYFPGANPSPAPPNILVDRPPPSSGLAGIFLQYGFPSTNPWPTSQTFLGNANFELWIDPSAFVWVLQPTPGNRSLRFQLANPPPGSNSFSIQAIALLQSPLQCPGGQLNDYAASPALVFQY